MRGHRKKNRRVTRTVRGVVALAEWSDSRDNADVVILTDDDEEYYVDASSTPIRPSKFVNSRVEATGRVYEMDDQTVLELKRMRPIESFQDFDDLNDNRFDDDEDNDDIGMGTWVEEADIESYARYIRSSGGLSD